MTVTTQTRATQSEAVDALFAEWDSTTSPGCAVGVFLDGEIVHARGYGMASLELGVPLSPESVFHVASVSKQFCAIAVAMLAADGQLSLDDDVRTHVPELPDFGETITVRQLIHHTNGLRDQYGLFRLAGWRDGDAQTFADVLDFAYRHRRLNFTPDSQWAYCNTSYTLLALIVQRVSGKSLREYTDEKIFAPLGMTNSRFLDDRNEVIPHRTNAYTPRDEGGFKTLNSNVDAVGAICLFTSVTDLLKWLQNFSERKVAGNVLDDAMTSAKLSNGELTGYGYGLAIEDYRGLRTVRHGGVDSGYRADLSWYPEANFGVVVLSNLSAVKPAHLANQIADIYLADRLGDRGIAGEPEVELSTEELERFTGIYIQEQTRQVRQVELTDGKLYMPSGFGKPAEMTPVAADRFRVEQPPYEVRFVQDDDRLQLVEIPKSGRTTTYTRIEPVEPTAEELAAYVGSYYCYDLDAIHRIYVRDGKLFVNSRKGDERELVPATPDTFTLPWTSITFRRDAYGQVDGFDFFNDRIRYLGFDRL